MQVDPREDYDSEVCEDLGVGDFDPETISLHRRLLGAQRWEHSFLLSHDADFLSQIGAVDQDSSGVPRPTLAGLVLLGKERAICRRFPHWKWSYKEIPEVDEAPWVSKDVASRKRLRAAI